VDLNTVLSVLLQVAVIWLAWRAGQWSILMPLRRVLERVAERQGMTLEQLVASAEEAKSTDGSQAEQTLDIERHGDRYYVYAQDGSFLAQGSDFDETFTALKQRFPGENFRINQSPQGLSDQEAGEMVKSIFRVFGSAK
jgi:hypothetical protein